MGKKRKSNGFNMANRERKREEPVQYNINENFTDSEDEFFTGRDHTLLDDGPLSKRRKAYKDDEFWQPSDEEVLGYDDDDDSALDDDQENDSSKSDVDGLVSGRDNDEDTEDNLRDWGTSKADYYNADVIETEADALEEEKEARRLQQKHLLTLTEADFGFDEKQWLEEDNAGDDLRKDTFTERLPELEIKDDASSEEKTQILRSRYPEFEPLAKDFMELQKVYEELSLATSTAELPLQRMRLSKKRKISDVKNGMEVYSPPLAITKFRALCAYLGTIGMYLALLTSTTNSSSTKLAMPPSELRGHPVVRGLIRSRVLWERMKDIPLPDVEAVVSEAEATGLDEVLPHLNSSSDGPAINGKVVAKAKRRTKAEKATIKAQNLAESERQTRMEKTEAELAKLDALVSAKRKESRVNRPKVSSEDKDSDFGDEDALTVQEAAEKAQKKKSLRFYTSQIAQKSNKRGAASRDAGGDADLPYKERLKDRQARLMREAEGRGRSKTEKEELLGNDSSGDDAEDIRLAKEIRGDDLDEDGYYDMVSARAKEKKGDRKALADAQARASKAGGQVYIEEEVGPDGKRAITYAIERNKGLAPRRKKEVRNPRVKKKIQYEQKMKKLGSIRQIYKGGEGRGGYGGELTGIKTNVLKGVKL